MNERRADLHLHTTASDGAWSPTELVDVASEIGLEAIAVTDHDTLAGIDEAVQRGEERGITVIPAVELSVRGKGQEVHLLGYCIDATSEPLLSTLAACQNDRLERIGKIVNRLTEQGISITTDEVLHRAKHGSAGRPHVARVLVEKGYVPSVVAAFDQLLAEGRPAYVPRKRLGLAEGVSVIHAAGGVAVCAHPGLLDDDSVVSELVSVGLDGLEIVHSEHSEAMQSRYLDLARQYGLLTTGGSDCHGPGIKQSLYIGDYTIPLEWVDALRSRAEERAARIRAGLSPAISK